jgi:hypothetical protein
MRYGVVDISSPEGETWFEIDLDEPPREGALLDMGAAVYRVVRIVGGQGDFSSFVAVERIASGEELT